jgi:hypothetical protein
MLLLPKLMEVWDKLMSLKISILLHKHKKQGSLVTSQSIFCLLWSQAMPGKRMSQAV